MYLLVFNLPQGASILLIPTIRLESSHGACVQSVNDRARVSYDHWPARCTTETALFKHCEYSLIKPVDLATMKDDDDELNDDDDDDDSE